MPLGNIGITCFCNFIFNLFIIYRLENAFYDLAQYYYQQQIKAVKLKLDNLSKYNHQPIKQSDLSVRYAFKIGFYNELKQDHHNAQKLV